MTKLSVNINKLATLRNSRGKNNPDVLQGARDVIRFGAQGITVHPRPDERHIRRSDVYALRRAKLGVEFNIEGYPSPDFLKMCEEVTPEQATLVPDPPEVLTSNAGWRVADNEVLLTRVTRQLKGKGIRVSLFIDPYSMTDAEYPLLKKIGVDRVELYTENYAETFGSLENEKVVAEYRRSAEQARSAGLGVNAGHDLDTANLAKLIEVIPWIDEVSIGHALICDALYWGLEATVKKYLECIRKGSEAARVSNPRQ